MAHNIEASHVGRSLRRVSGECLELEAAQLMSDEQADISRVERLRPLDREVMLLYLEDIEATAIGEITGLSARNVATKIHRIKAFFNPTRPTEHSP